jgi:hypothetical protein
MAKDHNEYYKKNVVKTLLALKALFQKEASKRRDQLAIIDALLVMTGEKGLVEEEGPDDYRPTMKH